MSQHLVITAVGSDRAGIGNQVIHLVSETGCNIIDSRIAIFGNEFTLIMLVSGNNAQIARVEHALPALGQEQDLITMMKRTSRHRETSQSFTLEAHIQSDDKVGLTEGITHFFAERNIGLDSLSARTLTKDRAQTEDDQFQISLTASLSDEYNLMELQEAFTALCERLGVTGTLNFLNNG
ncbi:glycine cleavage system transcriptional antiactivator gcvR [Vibrio ishigakensis]|uniref:Glycine cleavage system transcriptional repressor n=1 Tax=Vibrio ishigakensis TaxID=1481914 RepID=A0A0B8P5D3_9VIBR|nr:glycine cleavage system transcriptional antiactivator gcvR [Vibrio ishigakensis]GAM73095.1 glycine cleavage system transcriptional antiactivator gcvR [Vibrio ishigakensis]